MKLGSRELAYRQEVRNIDRLLNWEGNIRRKSRAVFERYLAHADERVREYAQRRRELHKQRESDLLEEECWVRRLSNMDPEIDVRDKTDIDDRESGWSDTDFEELPF